MFTTPSQEEGMGDEWWWKKWEFLKSIAGDIDSGCLSQTMPRVPLCSCLPQVYLILSYPSGLSNTEHNGRDLNNTQDILTRRQNAWVREWVKAWMKMMNEWMNTSLQGALMLIFLSLHYLRLSSLRSGPALVWACWGKPPAESVVNKPRREEDTIRRQAGERPAGDC